MFVLTQQERRFLRCQIGTLENGRGKYSKYASYVFTQEGVSMLSSVLNSKQAIRVNIQIMRAFVRMKELMTGNEELRRKLKSLERKFDKKFLVVFNAIRLLLDGPRKRVKVRGFGMNRAPLRA
jgi:hypothetical protein